MHLARLRWLPPPKRFGKETRVLLKLVAVAVAVAVAQVQVQVQVQVQKQMTVLWKVLCADVARKGR
jgi:hypothetical protein